MLTSFGAARLFVDCFIGDAPAFLEAFGGCDCGNNECEKIETLTKRGKKYSRVIEKTSKMTKKYSKIYNATQGKWAHDISGEGDTQKIYANNNWEENDALVGFHKNGGYEVIFCRPGYAVYVQTDDEEIMFRPWSNTNVCIPAPPALLVNLNDAFDGEFLFSKLHPVSPREEETKKEEKRLKSTDPERQRVIDFLYRCRDATNNKYKKAAYEKAIVEMKMAWMPCNVGPSIQRKIREFLEGFPEEDIIYS